MAFVAVKKGVEMTAVVKVAVTNNVVEAAQEWQALHTMALRLVIVVATLTMVVDGSGKAVTAWAPRAVAGARSVEGAQ